MAIIMFVHYIQIAKTNFVFFIRLHLSTWMVHSTWYNIFVHIIQSVDGSNRTGSSIAILQRSLYCSWPRQIEWTARTDGNLKCQRGSWEMKMKLSRQGV